MRRLALLPVLAAATLALTGCGTGDSFDEGFRAGSGQNAPAAPSAPSAPATTAPVSPAAAPVTQVTVPDVDGKNGAIALDELRAAGLTNIQPASRDTEDKFVVNPANWTVTSIEPGAGEDVASDSTVVVTMTKE